MIKSLSDRVELNNGTKIPGLGLGFQTWRSNCRSCKNGINGYRLIDTAAIYGNEKGTGIGIKEGLSNRFKTWRLFITLKSGTIIWLMMKLLLLLISLAKLDLDYLDLYLIHCRSRCFWRIMEGIGNFMLKEKLKRLA